MAWDSCIKQTKISHNKIVKILSKIYTWKAYLQANPKEDAPRSHSSPCSRCLPFPVWGFSPKKNPPIASPFFSPVIPFAPSYFFPSPRKTSTYCAVPHLSLPGVPTTAMALVTSFATRLQQLAILKSVPSHSQCPLPGDP